MNVCRNCRQEGGVDKDAGRLRAKPIVLSPQFGLSKVFERSDARGEVYDSLRPRYRTRDCLPIEQIEIGPPRSVDVVAPRTSQWDERTADRATAAGDE